MNRFIEQPLLDASDPYAWLDDKIKAQADYWQRQGLPADIISQVAEGIERYGDDFFDGGREEDHAVSAGEP